jgi:hypothetical protein
MPRGAVALIDLMVRKGVEVTRYGPEHPFRRDVTKALVSDDGKSIAFDLRECSGVDPHIGALQFDDQMFAFFRPGELNIAGEHQIDDAAAAIRALHWLVDLYFTSTSVSD